MYIKSNSTGFLLTTAQSSISLLFLWWWWWWWNRTLYAPILSHGSTVIGQIMHLYSPCDRKIRSRRLIVEIKCEPNRTEHLPFPVRLFGRLCLWRRLWSWKHWGTCGSVVTKRPHDALCLSVVSFNSTIRRAQSSISLLFLVSHFNFFCLFRVVD